MRQAIEERRFEPADLNEDEDEGQQELASRRSIIPSNDYYSSKAARERKARKDWLFEVFTEFKELYEAKIED